MSTVAETEKSSMNISHIGGGDSAPTAPPPPAPEEATHAIARAVYVESIRSHPETHALMADSPGNHAIRSGFGLTGMIAGLFGFDVLAKKLGLRDPAEKFAFVVGGTHLATPPLVRAMEVGRAVVRELAGREIVHVGSRGIVVSGGGALRTGAAVLTDGLPPTARALAATSGHALTGALRSIGAMPFELGGDALIADVLDRTLGEGLGQIFPDTFGAGKAGRAWFQMGAFFSRPVFDAFSHDAFSKWLASADAAATGVALESGEVLSTSAWLRSLAPRLFNGAAGLWGADFGTGLYTLGWNRLMHGRDAFWHITYMSRVGDAFHGQLPWWNPAKILRAGGIGEILGNYLATTLPTSNEQLIALRTLVRDQDQWRARQFPDVLREWGLRHFTVDDTLDDTVDWSQRVRNGWLTRVDTPDFLATYDRTKDGATSIYHIVRQLGTLGGAFGSQAVLDLFDDDFVHSPPQDDDLESGVSSVLQPGQEAAFLEWLGGPEKILEQRRQILYRAMIEAEGQHAFAQAVAKDTPIVRTAAERLRGVQDAVRAAGWLADDGSITEHRDYYQSLGAYARNAVATGTAEQKMPLQAWVHRRLALLRQDTLLEGTRTRILRELRVVNPELVLADADPARAEAQAAVHDWQPLTHDPSALTARAMEETAAHWTGIATNILADYAHAARPSAISGRSALARSDALRETFDALRDQSPATHPALSDVASMLRLAIDATEALPASTTTFATFDPATGLPQDFNAFVKLVEPAMLEKIHTTTDDVLMETTPAHVARGRSVFKELSAQAYRENTPKLGKQLAAWWVDAQLANTDWRKHVTAQLADPAHADVARGIRAQVTLQTDAGLTPRTPHDYRAQDIFTPEGTVHDWDLLEQWIVRDYPFAHRLLADTIGQTLAWWQVEAIAGKEILEPALIRNHARARLYSAEGRETRHALQVLNQVEAGKNAYWEMWPGAGVSVGLATPRGTIEDWPRLDRWLRTEGHLEKVAQPVMDEAIAVYDQLDAHDPDRDTLRRAIDALDNLRESGVSNWDVREGVRKTLAHGAKILFGLATK